MKERSIWGRKIKDCIIRFFSGCAVCCAVGAMVWILFTVGSYGSRALSVGFFLNPSKPYGMADGGIANALLGTVFITLGAAAIAIVPGICGGIFLAEYREHTGVNAALRFCANVMMGMPSVLVGLFVYLLIVVNCGHFSGLAASVALAMIMFPVIMRTTEDMLRMVPDSLRESALALGTTRMGTTLKIVCVSARRGLLTGILLSLSRVSGETAPLLFTAMFADGWPFDYFTGPTANMPILITEYSTNSPFESMHRAGWGAALAVMVLVLGMNLSARFFFREEKHGR